MVIERASLLNFRNYVSESVEFAPGVNLVIGDNAQGKTNLIEAVHLLSIGRSVRTPKLGELIRFGEKQGTVSLTANKKEGRYTVEMTLSGRDKRQVLINGLPVSRLGELMGVVSTVMFTPDEIGIIKAAPKTRRRFLDIALCQLSKAYFYALSKYNKVLSQRNRLLKEGGTRDELDVWDLQLIPFGAKVVYMRRQYMSVLESYAKTEHEFLTDGGEVLSLTYDGIAGLDEGEVAENYKRALIDTREKDTFLRFTHVGPHGDDFLIKADGIDLRKYGSQGQQRTAALSLKLAELAYFEATEGDAPILLLDDVFSELDPHRQEKLKARLSGHQTIITLTDAQYDDMPGARVIRVTDGSITVQG